MLQELRKEEHLVGDEDVGTIDVGIGLVKSRETGALGCSSLLVNTAGRVVQFHVADGMGIGVGRLAAGEVAQTGPEKGLQRMITGMTLAGELTDQSEVVGEPQ